MADMINIGRDAASVKEAPAQPAYSGVKIFCGQDEDGNDLYFFAGNESGSILELENPWGTQAMANNILQAVSGYSYRPLSAEDVLLNPAAELGDAITVNGVYSVLARCDTTYGSLLVSSIAAPSDGELGHEYPYISKGDRKAQRRISRASSLLSVQINEIKAQVTDDDGNYTVLTLKSDGLYVGGTSTTLDGNNITDGTIGTDELENGAITGPKIADLSITGTKIAANAISTEKIAANAVTTNEIAARTIKASNIASGTITAAQIAANTITADEIAAGTITASEISSEAITTNKLLLTGMVSFYNGLSKTAFASLGYGMGYDGSSGQMTYGAMMAASNGQNYIIVTNGGARMSAGSGYIYTVNGACWCSHQFQVGSDINIKEDISDDMSRYKEVLMHLRPVSFRYKDTWSPSTQRQTGFIAQEAEAVIAEYEAGNWGMTNISGEGLHCINYEALIPVLVACVQDMARDIAELKERE